MEFIKLFLVLIGVDLVWGKSLYGINAAEVNIDNEDDYYYNVDGSDVRFLNWLFIFPGTKWCGKGTIAYDYDDLGESIETDKCCRKHDQCDDYINGYQTAHNLTNPAFYTRLSCDCDEEFYKCLKKLNTTDSAAVGAIYFNFLGTKCFKKEHVVKTCNKFAYIPRQKCTSYSINVNSQKVYQWFDVPIF